MQLVNAELQIHEIILDPFNPRFNEVFTNDQEKIQKRLMELGSTKELLSSMKSGLTWVNKIVVRKISTYTEHEQTDLSSNTSDFKYVVVEGNTRLACLKDVNMTNFDKSSNIPVIIAEKETEESQESYERELRRLQGIANVMVVKDWKPIPKAKHIYRLYKDKKDQNPDTSNTRIFKSISDELGIKPGDVKGSVFKYIFYQEITENREPINEGDWKFLELFEQNERIRKMFGWKDSHSDFEWNFDNIQEDLLELVEDDSLTKQELLYLFPKIIESAKRENLSSKILRDTLRDVIIEGKNAEDLLSDMKDIIDSESSDYKYDNWKKHYLKQREETDNKLKWDNNLNQILEWLKQFPMNEDWAIQQKEKLEEIQKKTKPIISYLKSLDDVEVQ